MVNEPLENLLKLEYLKNVPIKNSVDNPKGISIPPDTKLSAILKYFHNPSYKLEGDYTDATPILVVTDSNKAYQGIIREDELIKAFSIADEQKTLDNVLHVDAKSIMLRAKTIRPEDNVHYALTTFKETGQEVFPVTRDGIYKGLLSKQRLINELLLIESKVWIIKDLSLLVYRSQQLRL